MTANDLATQARDQLAGLLTHYLRALEMALPGGDFSTRVHPSQIDGAAEMIVEALIDPDPEMRHEGLISLAPWIDPPGLPVSDDWWTTPLGLLATAAQPADGAVEDDWVTQRQAADALGVSERTIVRMLDRGTLTAGPAGPTGGRTVSRREVSELVVERATK